jgi:predicted amidohydrolase YtcJ
MPASHPPVTLYPARRILTMDRAEPEASCVAVRDGRILAVGTREELAGWGAHRVDDRYAESVLMPGLVEAHCHLLEGAMWEHAYVGFYPRRGPDGRLWPGCTTIDQVVEALITAERALPEADAPMLAWGLDPILYRGARMVRRDLDRVSLRRPIAVIHANFHALNVNSAMLAHAGIQESFAVDGAMRDDAGALTGELAEMAAMFPVFRRIGDPFAKGRTEKAARNFALLAQAAGVTTAIDITNDLSGESTEMLRRVTRDDAFPLRMVAGFFAQSVAPREGIERVRAHLGLGHDKLRYGPVKLMTDGSIQGFTARLRWPGYYDGHPNGIWNIAPAMLDEIVAAYHDAGLQLHVHVNGDEANDVALDAFERALSRNPRPDHRHTLHHCQLADAAQLGRVHALSMCVNLFANHLYYWGDVHHDVTVGPDRARRMNAAGTASRLGIPFAIHSDAPVTPIAPLFTAWCAVNRRSASGRLLGARERIGVQEALESITLGAAYTLRLEHELGSIVPGKRADFTVLADDPLQVPPEALKDVRIAGTMLGGVAFDVPGGVPLRAAGSR